MALQMTVTTPHGFEATDAYHRVEMVSVPEKSSIQFMLRSYKDASSQTSFADESYRCNHDLNGGNVIAQAYIYLKTLEAFDGATDV